jgi:hypothetical protein
VPWELSSGPLHRGDLETGMTFSFALPLPPDGLPNCRSEHGELYWRVHLKSAEFGPDTTDHQRIVVEAQRRIVGPSGILSGRRPAGSAGPLARAFLRTLRGGRSGEVVDAERDENPGSDQNRALLRALQRRPSGHHVCGCDSAEGESE